MKKAEASERKIDLVYLWVDGNDKNWRREKEKWAKACNIVSDAANDCRFIDNEELRYSLRSVAQNAPWINQIFIVTNGQVPSWLNTSHPKIKIITHDQIMPKDALPTFNSEAIETCIANIPGLSEYFLYANDDFFIGKPITPDYFFDEDGNPIVRLVAQNWSKESIEKSIFLGTITHCIDLIEQKYGTRYAYEASHNIDAYRVSYIKKCIEEFPEEVKRTTYARFRIPHSFQRTIYSYYMLANQAATLKVCKIHKDTKPMENLYIPVGSRSSMQALLDKNNPYLFCVNDEEKTQDDERCGVKSFLNSIYTQKTLMELEEDLQIHPAFESNNVKTIVFAPDNGYCKYFSVALRSLVDNSDKNSKYDILVFHNNINGFNQTQLTKMVPSNFSMRFIGIDHYIYSIFGNVNLQPRKYWSISMYYRIFIPLIMRQYSKVLYCDSDICFNHKIDELFKLNFNDKCIMAAIDNISTVLYRDKKRNKYMQDVLKLKNPETYFNSGILLFNIQKINPEKYKRKFCDVLNIENLLYPDQDMLNIMFENNVQYLPRQWNYLYGDCAYNPSFENLVPHKYREEFLEARENPYIIHYTSPRKPWNYPIGEHADIWWRYARQTPYYEEILFSNIKGKVQNGKSNNGNWFVNKDIVSFCKIPLIKVRRDPNSCRVYLFKFIPLYKITYRKQWTAFKLFNFLPLFKIKKI